MPSRPVLIDEQSGFSQGMSAQAGREPSNPAQFVTATNMRLIQNNEMAKRPGLRQLFTFTSTPYFVSAWFPTASFPQIVWATTADGFLRYATFNATTGALTTGNTSVVANTSGESTAQFRDATAECLYISCNGNKIAKFDGTVATAAVGTPTNIHALWVYNQRLFGCTGIDQTLYWSDLNNGDTLGTVASGGGSAAIRTFGTGAVVGGFALGGINYIVHSQGLSYFQGRTFDDIQIQAGTAGVTPDIRPLSGRSWNVVDLTGYIVTYKGLYTVGVGGNVTPYETPEIPDPIRALVQGNWSVNVNSITDNTRTNEIWFSLRVQAVSGGDGTVQVLIYNKELRRFVGVASGVTNSGQAQMYVQFAAGGLLAGIVIPQLFNWDGATGLQGADFATTSLNVFQDNGQNYTSSVQCRRMFTDSPQNTKAFRTALVQMGSGTDGSLAVGATTGATVSYTTPVGGAVASAAPLLALETNRVPLSGQGQYVDVTITDGGLVSTDWSVQRVDMQAFDYGQRGA